MQIDWQSIGSVLSSNVSSVVIGAVGLVGMIVLYFRGKRERRPRYEYSHNTIIDDVSGGLNGLKVLYNGEQLGRVTVAKVAFWNAGRETIRKSDLVDADPLRIEVRPGVKVLDARVVKQTNPANRFSVN
jgi:hypothetical protein